MEEGATFLKAPATAQDLENMLENSLTQWITLPPLPVPSPDSRRGYFCQEINDCAQSTMYSM